MIGTVLFVSGFAVVVMLVGVLLAKAFPMFRNFRRMYWFGAAAAGAVFLVTLAVAGVMGLARLLQS